MTTFISFEFKKFFKRKKNLIGIVFITVFILMYILINNSLEGKRVASEAFRCTEDIKSVQQAISTIKNDNKSENKTMLSAPKFIIDSYENQLNLLERKKEALAKNDWKTNLSINIKLDKILINGVKLGNTVTGEKPEVIQNRIKKNEMLLHMNIKPIDDISSMKSYNFLRLSGMNIVPLFLIILLFLFASDSVSNETDEGTFKILLIQPISRNKIMLSKIISYTLICILIVTVIFLTFFLGLGLVKGFGSPYYPTSYYPGSLSNIFSSNKLYELKMISIRQFILYMIPIYILVITAMVAFSVLISTLINNSTGAICFSIIFYITFYIFNTQLRFFTKLAHFIPFTYTNIPSLLDGTAITQLGNKNITYINGVIVLTVFTLFCYSLSFVLFRKKDIL